MVGGDSLIWPLEERERYLVTAEQVEARRRQWLDDRRERKLGGLRRIQAIGIDRVRVSTAQDERVCRRCTARDGVVIATVEAASGLPCENENDGCRCVYIPVIPEAEG